MTPQLPSIISEVPTVKGHKDSIKGPMGGPGGRTLYGTFNKPRPGLGTIKLIIYTYSLHCLRCPSPSQRRSSAEAMAKAPSDLGV